MGWLKNIGLPKSRDGRSLTPYYKFYRNMMNECLADYGKKFGKIDVCREWKYDFWKFVADIKPIFKKKYRKGYWMGRLDVTKDFDKGNVFFGTIQEIMWTRKNTHKIEVNGTIKYVPQVHKILNEQGIEINEQAVRDRARNKTSIGRKNEHHKYKWNGKLLSLKTICKENYADYPRAKYWRSKGKSLRKSVELAKENWHPQREYNHNGQKYNQTQLAEVLAKEVGITKGGMRNRLKKGLSIDDCKKGFKLVSFNH